MTQWAADSVKKRSVEEIIPYDRNPKLHPEAQVKQIANSIREWGWTMPILLDENDQVLAGHGRLFAAKELGLSEVPCMTAVGWSDQQKRAYVIADNKLTENSKWDEELLKSEIKQLEFEEYNLDFIGFEVDELTNLFLDKEFGKTDAIEEWTDMPEYEALDPCYKKVVVSFEDEDSFNEFFALVGQSHTEKTKSIWFPEKEKRN
jgi:hypothetical protein